jgi:hypothetical protein
LTGVFVAVIGGVLTLDFAGVLVAVFTFGFVFDFEFAAFLFLSVFAVDDFGGVLAVFALVFGAGFVVFFAFVFAGDFFGVGAVLARFGVGVAFFFGVGVGFLAERDCANPVTSPKNAGMTIIKTANNVAAFRRALEISILIVIFIFVSVLRATPGRCAEGLKASFA